MSAALVGVALGVGGLIVYGLFAWERIVHRRRELDPGSSWGASAQARAARPDTTPDTPLGFGANTAWLAVRTQNGNALVQQLALRTVLPANWRAGLKDTGERGVFVSPPIDGWVFAVGRDLIAPEGNEEAFVTELLQRLSRTFGHAQWFCSDAQDDRHGWALAFDGKLQRGYAFAGERGHVWWAGEPTAAEQQAQCFVDDPRDQSDDDVKWWPDLAIVRSLAAAWGLDPLSLAQRAVAPGTGWVGRFGSA